MKIIIKRGEFCKYHKKWEYEIIIHNQIFNRLFRTKVEVEKFAKKTKLALDKAFKEFEYKKESK